MPKAAANGIEVEYETFGDAGAPPLLLVMGLGAQLLSWMEGFCQELASRGFRVIRYDNRDVGLSTYFDEAGLPDFTALMADRTLPVPYTIDDFAADGMALLSALGIGRAHIVGASMGGSIAQQMAIGYPERVLSLTSIMSYTGGEETVPPTPEALSVLLTRPPAGREAYLEWALWTHRVTWGPSFDESRARERSALAYDRAFHPDGTARHFAAVLAHPSHLPGLRKLTMPVLVVHGEDDPLVPVDNGRMTAEAVPGAELLLMPGVGHDIPPAWWGRLADAIAANAGRAGGHTERRVGVAER